MIDFNNPSNYKVCRKKQVNYWMCIPPKGTVVVNCLDQYDVLVYLRQYIPVLKKRCFLTSDEFRGIRERNPQLAQFIQQNCFVVDETTNIVLCGTEGELYTTTYNFVCSRYNMYSQSGVVPIQSVINERASKYNNENVLTWTRIVNKVDSKVQTFACFVPSNQVGSLITGQGAKLNYNSKGIKHGKGDFIVCESLNGKPNLNSRWVVNGLVFSNTYDNRGWVECIQVGLMNNIEPEPLFSNKSGVVSEGTSLSRLLSWYKKHNLTECYNILSSIKIGEKSMKTFLSQIEAVDYLHKNYFRDTTIEADTYYLNPDEISGYYLMLSDSTYTINIYFDGTLCGWNYDSMDFADDPLEMSYNSKSDLDKFGKMLNVRGSSNYERILEICKEQPSHTELLKRFKDLDNSIIDAINNTHIHYSFIRNCLLNINKLYNEFRTSKSSLCFDYDYEETFRFDLFGCKFGDITISLGLEDLSVNLCYFCEDGNCNEVYVSYNVYSDYVKAYKSLTGDTVKADNQRVAVSGKHTLFGLGEKYMYFYDGSHWFRTLYISSLDFLVDVGSVYDSELNLTNNFDYIDWHWVSEKASKYNLSYNNSIVKKLIDNIIPRECSKNGITNLNADDFVQAFFKNLDFITNKCVYNKVSPYFDGVVSDRTEATLEVLHITQVKRVFGVVRYPCGYNIYVNISKSTLEILQYDFPEKVTMNLGGSRPNVKFITMHYYQLMLRMGLIRYTFNVKVLKKLFMEYNSSIFGDKIEHKTIISLCNYSVIQNPSDYSAFAHNVNGGEYIVFEGNNHDLQRVDLSSYTKCTLVHEMCHSYTRAVYGTTQELPGEDGGTIYNIDERYKSQWRCHGKRFGEAVQMASEYTGLPFEVIFGYGLDTRKGMKYLSGTFDGSKKLTLNSKNAFNCGQPYRGSLNKYLSTEDTKYYCPAHQKLGCNCGGQLVELKSDSIYAVCHQCGKLHSFSSQDLAEIAGVSSDYFDYTDELGVVLASKCSCGGSLTPLVDSMYQKDFNLYLKDYKFSDRYVSHMVSMCNTNKSKYEIYFARNYGCQLSITRNNIPVLCVDIFNNQGFKEMYKLFVTTGNNGRPIGRLYRDYGLDSKGFLLHTFRINAEKDVLKFLDYVMTYIRSDLRGH